jgi:AcrR family transcriptional regulator
VAGKTVTKRRQTQAERSDNTQEKILNAALSCIERLGLNNASTHEIAREAEVSRGALLHHFPSRADLIHATFSKLLEEEFEKLSKFSQELKNDPESIDKFIRYVWSRYKGRVFLLTVDYLSLGRVDPQTLRIVTPIATEFNERLNAVWDIGFYGANVPLEERRAYMNQTMCLIRGMALQRLWRKDEAYFENMLSDWIENLMSNFQRGT